jgi:hypothetical protein
MPVDSTLLLLNRADVDSGNDGAGTGTDATAAGGAVIDLDEGAHVAVVFQFGEAGATVAQDADTCDIICEVSPDNSNWGTVATLRQILGSEINTIDESTGSVGLKFAIPFVVPLADGVTLTGSKVKCRLTTTISATRHFSIYAYIAPQSEVPQRWYDNAAVNA